MRQNAVRDNKEKRVTRSFFINTLEEENLVYWTAFRIDPVPNIDNVALFKARYNLYDYEISIIRLDSSVCKLSSIN